MGALVICARHLRSVHGSRQIRVAEVRGLSAVEDNCLEPFAGRFRRAGTAALVFDDLGTKASGVEP